MIEETDVQEAAAVVADEAVVETDVNKLTFRDLDDGVLHLPGGYLAEDGTLHTEVSLREMTGEEEDILLSRKTPGHLKIEAILVNCVTKIGDITDKSDIATAVRKMIVGDRVVMLLALRCISLGSEYRFGSICGSCEAKNTHTVEILDLEVKRPLDPRTLVHVIALPSGAQATVRVMTGEDEAKLAKFRRGVGKKKVDGSEDVMTLNILARLQALNGVRANAKTTKSLSLRDRTAIRSWFVANEGGVDTKLELECDSCGAEYESVMDAGQPDFFFPRESEE